jgi:hypothetical protein
MAMKGETITLTDEVGRSLVCQIEMAVELGGASYGLLSPADYPVDIFSWMESDQDDEEMLVPLEDSELGEVFSTAEAVLAEQNLKLHRSALSLTVTGDLPDVDEEQLLVLELEDAGEGDEPDEYQLLATFYHDNQEYVIYTPLEPVLFVVRLQSNGPPELLSPEEFQAIQPQLQPLFEEQMLDEFE